MRIFRGSFRFFYLILLELVGWTVVLAGIAMLVLPGPGILGIFFGIVILSNRYDWAKRLRHRSRGWVEESTRASVATNGRIFVSAFMIFLIICASVFVYRDMTIPFGIEFELFGIMIGPTLPGGGKVVGLTMFGSTIIAFSLLMYGILTYRWKARPPRQVSE